MAPHGSTLTAAALSSEHLPDWTLPWRGGLLRGHLALLPTWSFLGALCGSLKMQVLAQSWRIPFLSLPQCVSETGAAALGLDFNNLLVTNKNKLDGLMVGLLTGQGHHSGCQSWWGKSIAWPLHPHRDFAVCSHTIHTLPFAVALGPSSSCLHPWRWGSLCRAHMSLCCCEEGTGHHHLPPLPLHHCWNERLVGMLGPGG